MTGDVITRLLPLLSSSAARAFNVFDVMRHGTHEKQISNVFGWLLDAEGSHNLGRMFQRILVDEVNRGFAHSNGQAPFGEGPYVVHQEVNTSSATGDPHDVADIVLEGDAEVLVIENYFTSDGHGHSYEGYLRHGQRDDRRSGVVLLCRDEDSSRQTAGWQQASVITYSACVDRLRAELDTRADYKRENPESYSFIDQMQRKFATKGTQVEDRQVLDFVTAMCATGEAKRYRDQSQDLAAEKFAEAVAQQAVERFGEGREILQRIKGRLKQFGEDVLVTQLNETLGDGFVSGVSARYAGIYQWTINFHVSEEAETFGDAEFQLKFGPSAWYANEQDSHWTRAVDQEVVDYSHVFLTRARSKEIRQSSVSLHDVLDGLSADDRRLHDEIVEMLGTR